jgi:hypothetical protein
VSERVCVHCGSPAPNEERFSCDECGGAIVSVEARQTSTVPAPPPRSGSGDWAPPGYNEVDPDWQAPAFTPPEHPIRSAFRARTNRAIAGATLMLLVVIGAIVTITVLAVHAASTKPTPISKDMRAYAAGFGSAYRTKSFSVRLPDGFHKNKVTVRLSDGRHMTFQVASASNTITALAVASSPVDAKLAKRLPNEAQTIATQIDAQMNVGAAQYSVHEHLVEFHPAWDMTAKADVGPSAAVRIVLYPHEIVVLAAAGATNLPGDLKAVEATYQHA